MRVWILAFLLTSGVTIAQARATEAEPSIMSAFALTRGDQTPSRVIEYYSTDHRGHQVQAPQSDMMHHHLTRS